MITFRARRPARATRTAAPMLPTGTTGPQRVMSGTTGHIEGMTTRAPLARALAPGRPRSAPYGTRQNVSACRADHVWCPFRLADIGSEIHLSYADAISWSGFHDVLPYRLAASF
jgi:hypothetical protein